jgi:hypothetical protein
MKRLGSRRLIGKFALIIGCALFAASGANGQRRAPQAAPQPESGMLHRQRPAMMQESGCTVSQLELRFQTGNDDLRGGQNNLNVEVHFADGTMQVATNVNQGANWPKSSLRSALVRLKQPVAPSEIRLIKLVHLAQAGFNPPAGSLGALATPAGPPGALASMASGVKSEDNWDMASFQAFAQGKTSIPIASFGFHRFTGSNPSLEVSTRSSGNCPSPNDVRELEFTFHTGNDDLRGGEDDLTISIGFADGTTQTAPNVNHGERWADGSTHTVQVLLSRLLSIEQIKSITLSTTFKGGNAGDNWNMDSVEIMADHRRLATYGFHRFSADWTGPKARTLTIATK